MANNYYNPSNAPATSSSLSSATMRAEFAAIGQAADKLAPLTGNGDKVLVVNPGGTAQTSKAAATVVAEAGAGVASKATPVDADGVMVVDTEASNALKRLTWANLKTAVKGYYDAVASTLTNKTLNLSSNTLSGTKAQFNTALSDADFLTTADLVTVPQGGTGVATITGLVKGNGAAAMSAAVAGTDYQAAQSVTGMVKSSGVTRSAAVAGTDYTSPTGAETLSNKTITGSTGAFTTLSATGGVTSGNNGYAFIASGAVGSNGYFQSTNGTQNLVFGRSSSNLCVAGTLSADNFLLYANGAAVATLSSTGLSVTGALSSTGRHSATADQTTPTDGSAYFYKSSAGAVVSGSQVVLETGSAGSRSTKVTVDNSGNVGIGVTSPVNKLDVLGGVTVGGFYRDADVTSVGTAGMLLELGARSGATRTPGAAIGATLANPATTGAIQLFTRAGGALVERVRVSSEGGVGIGTTSPASSLDITRAPDATYNSHILLNSTTNAAKIAFNPSGVTSSGIGADATGLRFYGSDANTVRATLDYSGNLGLGVTPSAWGTFKAMEVNRASLASTGVETEFTHNAYWNGTNFIYKATDYATRLRQINGQHQWYTAPSGTAGNAITFTQAMTLDASGNLGLGVTPSAWGSLFKSIDVSTASSFTAGAVGQPIVGNNFYNDNTNNRYKTSSFASKYEQASGQHQWYTAPSGTAGNAITFTQAMVLDANSNLAVTGSVTIGSFTTATRPAHAAGKMIYVSDASAGSKFQGSDGSSWVSLG